MLELQPVIGRYVLQFETVSGLLESGHGTKDRKPIETITAMANKAKIERQTISDGDVSVNQDMSLDEAEDEDDGCRKRTAFLSDEVTELVYMSECYDPGDFYLTIVSNVEALRQLEEDMKLRYETEQSTTFHNAKLGDYVICNDSGSAMRGQVERVETVSDSDRRGELVIQNTYTVLLLDVGSRVTVSGSELAECPSEFLTRLPFQAIRCRLGQVRPLSSRDWTPEAGDRLFEMTRTEEDFQMPLECNLLSRDVSGVSDVQIRGGVNLAEDLVRNGYAVWDISDIEETISTEDRSANKDADFDAPNGLDLDLVNIDKLKEVTGQELADYLDENLNIEPKKDDNFSKTLDSRVRLSAVNSCSSQDNLNKPRAIERICSNTSVPTLAVPGDVDTVRKCPSLTWNQSEEMLNIKVKVFSRFDLLPNQVK